MKRWCIYIVNRNDQYLAIYVHCFHTYWGLLHFVHKWIIWTVMDSDIKQHTLSRLVSLTVIVPSNSLLLREKISLIKYLSGLRSEARIFRKSIGFLITTGHCQFDLDCPACYTYYRRNIPLTYTNKTPYTYSCCIW